MAYEPTKSANAGRFQSRGEDLVQYVGDKGDLIAGLDYNGKFFAKDFVANGVSLSALGTQVSNMILTGLPSVIDEGTF